tara:strand:- start:167 stop:727 length:561 start_codon:yes stop_codon:yes gene_type:complete
MNSKILFIYKFNKLFEILNEIKENFNFELKSINENDFKKLNFDELQNYLIVSTDICNDNKNRLKLDKTPLKLSDLIEKINLNFLRNHFNNQSELKIGKYILDLNSRKIYFKNNSLNLTEKESDLILFISSNKKASLKELQRQVWGYSKDLETHTVETHIYRLRKKILKNFNDDNFIKHNKQGYFLN